MRFKKTAAVGAALAMLTTGLGGARQRTPAAKVSPFASGSMAVTRPTRYAPATVAGTTVALSAIGTDDGGAANLTYTWTVASAPTVPPAVTFSTNGTNGAQSSTATFGMGGAYTFLVTVRDTGGLTATATATVTVNQTLTAVTISPSAATVPTGGTQSFTAAAKDQFGRPMANTPAVTWRVTGVGSVSTSGTYTAPATAGSATVTATAGAVSGNAAVTVTAPPPPAVNYTGGFAGATLQRNGSTAIVGNRLRLTSGPNQRGSAFAKQAIDVSRFTSQFQFQLGSLDGNPWSLGDGLTFVLQSKAPTALGTGGSGLGYAGIASSVAVKFDLVNNVGEGGNSTGLYSGGALRRIRRLTSRRATSTCTAGTCSRRTWSTMGRP